MGFCLESMDGLLPVSGQNIAIIADQALIDLSDYQPFNRTAPAGYLYSFVHLPKPLDTIPVLVQSPALKAAIGVSKIVRTLLSLSSGAEALVYLLLRLRLIRR